MSSHPTPGELAAFLQEKLDSKRQEEIEKHVNSCSECEQALNELETQLKLPDEDSVVKCPSNLLNELKQASPETIGNSTAELMRESAARSVAENLPKSIGPFPVLKKLGKGGMGIVYLARDLTFDRRLAVKLVGEHLKDDSQSYQRFKDEARIMAQLQHPGIPPVHSYGKGPDGRPYLAMKVVEGNTLSRELVNIIKENKLKDAWPRLLTIFGQVCQTMAFAHENNVIYRDLKPGNIMVGKLGEVQVMDWGLAKQLQGRPNAVPVAVPVAAASAPSKVGGHMPTNRLTNADSWETAAGVVLGTPAYMAPEQALGEIDNVDKQTDVFGLGAILCHILTGHPPYLKSDDAFIQTRIEQGNLQATWDRLDKCGADPQLINLCKSCLEPDKSKRLKDAGEVANAVTEYQQEVETKLRQTEVQRERNRFWMLSAVASLVVVVGLAVGWISYANYRAEKTQQHNQRASDTRQDAKSELQNSQTIIAKSPDAIREHDLKRWGSLLSGADLPLKSAEKILKENKDVAPPELVDQVKQMRISLKLDTQDHRLMVQLDDVLLQSVEPPEFNNGNRKNFNAAKAYKKAFREYGITEKTTPSQVADRVNKRSKQVRDKIINALDNWMIVAVTKNEGPTVQWLKKVLTATDPDPFRTLVRLDIVEKAAASLKSKAEKLDMRKHSLANIHLLGSALLENDNQGVRAYLQKAHIHYPADFWINYQLGELYLGLKEYDKAIHHCNVAVAVRPKSSSAHFTMARSFESKKEFLAASLAYKRAIDANPDFGPAHYNLGAMYINLGEPQKSLPHFQIALKYNLHLDHGYNSIGAAYVSMGKFSEACQAYAKAIQLSPKDTLFHKNLALAKYWGADLKGAIKAFRDRLNLQPNSLYIIGKLGVLYEYQNDLKAAEEILRQGIRIDPDTGTLYSNLSLILREQGKFQEALAAQQKATDLAKATRGNYDRNVRVLNLCKRLAELNSQWNSIASGNTKPMNEEDFFDFAKLCYYRGHYAKAANFLEEGFIKQQTDSGNRIDINRMGTDDRRMFLRATAHAGANSGNDANTLREQTRSVWRTKTFQVLQARLNVMRSLSEKNDNKLSEESELTLRRWLMIWHFAKLREPEHLAKLPQAERQRFQAFWTDVRTLLRQAGQEHKNVGTANDF